MTPLARRFRSLEPVRLFGVDALIADSFASRLLGLAFLAGHPDLPALLFEGCRSVHTVGMRFPLDICLIDGSGHALVWHRGVGPGRLIGASRARSVLEVPVSAQRTGRGGGREAPAPASVRSDASRARREGPDSPL